MSGGMLYPGADRDYRSQIIRRHVTKINAMVDQRELTLRESRLAKNSQACLFKGEKLRGEWTQEHRVFYEGEPAFISKAAAALGENGRFPNGIASRGTGSQDIRVPVLTTVNGEYGRTPFEIESRLSFLGIIDQVNRDNNETTANVLTGGITTTHSSVTYIGLGEPVMACVPTEQEADTLASPAGNAANSLGRGGRVPMVWKPFRPQEIDFYRLEPIRKAIPRFYEQTGAPPVWTKKVTGPTRSNAYVYEVFDDTVCSMVEGFAHFIAASQHLSNGAVVLADAAESTAAVATARNNVINAMLFSGTRTFGAFGTFNLGGLAAAHGVAGAVPAHTQTLLLDHPLQKVIRAMANLKLITEDRVAGRATLTGAKGKNFDIHLHRYAH